MNETLTKLNSFLNDKLESLGKLVEEHPEKLTVKDIAEFLVKTSGGYKSYNLKTGRLTNCDSFVFGDTEEMFFVIPTNKAARGKRV